MSANALSCPGCESTSFVKNGRIHNGRQNFKCKACGRQFVQNPTKKVIGQKTRDLIDKLLLESLSEAVITALHGSVKAMATFLMSILNMRRHDSKLRLRRKKGAVND